MERLLIFISYRRVESAGYAGRLHESLERRLGDGQVFRDVDGIEPGQDFVDAIAARLAECTTCLVMIGREWLHVTDRDGRRRLEQPHDYVRLEIEAALARSDLLIVPVLVEGMTMPSAEDLPPSIRALSRRHALSLRDETWDTDVDRLVGTLEKPLSRLPRLLKRRLLAWPTAAVAAAILAVTFVSMFVARRADRPATGAASATDSSAGDAGARTSTTPRRIALPRLAEVASGERIYTVLAGDIVEHGSGRTLRLRLRLSNEGSSPANFWDNTFRLAVQGQSVAPTSGLNEVVSGHAIQQGVIAFDLSAGPAGAALQVVDEGVTAEVPLDLTDTGAPSSVDNPDPGDALSHAQVVRLARDGVVLVDKKEVGYTLVSMNARRFANTLRIFATIRVSNNGPDPWLFGADAMRLLVDGRPLAPIATPNVPVAASSTMSGDFVFDVPPATRRVVLRVTSAPDADAPFDLPPALQ